MRKLLHLITRYFAVAFGESVWEQGSTGEGPCLGGSVLEVLGEKFCQRVVKGFAYVAAFLEFLCL